MRVGTPEQVVRVLASTAASESMVVLSQYGCSRAVLSMIPNNCASSRGMMFSPNASSTWWDQGLYGINGNGVGLEANLGYVQRAIFGIDALGVGVSGMRGATLKNQTLAGIASASPFYLYVFISLHRTVILTCVKWHSRTRDTANQLYVYWKLLIAFVLHHLEVPELNT